MNQFNVYRADRYMSHSQFELGGGVCIAISSNIYSEQIPLNNTKIEHIAVKLSENMKSIIIYCAYIPPNSHTNTYQTI